MAVAKIGRRGQMVLPVEIRRDLGVTEGDRILFFVEEGEVVIRPLKRSLQDLRGSISVEGPQDFEKIRSEVRKKRSRRRTTES